MIDLKQKIKDNLSLLSEKDLVSVLGFTEKLNQERLDFELRKEKLVKKISEINDIEVIIKLEKFLKDLFKESINEIKAYCDKVKSEDRDINQRELIKFLPTSFESLVENKNGYVDSEDIEFVKNVFA